MQRRKRPSDPIMLAKLIGDIATGQVQDEVQPAPTSEEIRRVMSALGKVGGHRGGEARAKALSGRRKKEIARKAARARWSKRGK